jgi:hypothetical protein
MPPRTMQDVRSVLPPPALGATHHKTGTKAGRAHERIRDGCGLPAPRRRYEPGRHRIPCQRPRGYRDQRSASPAVVSSVWQTRYRVLWQELEQWADGLRGAQPPATLADHTVRLLTFAVTLLEQHRVNKRGQCQFCCWSRWTWRFWHRRPRCTVCRALAFALRQSLDVVWWQLLGSTGKKCSLVDVREWLRQREQG